MKEEEKENTQLWLTGCAKKLLYVVLYPDTVIDHLHKLTISHIPVLVLVTVHPNM